MASGRPGDLLAGVPKRTDPRTGKVHSSVLKPVGQPYTNRTIELDSEKVVSVTLQPANENEIADTVAVMGGEDWRRWMDMLLEEKLLAPGARTLAYSYIGPEITWPIYRDGTIGQAKKDLEHAAKDWMQSWRINWAATPGYPSTKRW